MQTLDYHSIQANQSGKSMKYWHQSDMSWVPVRQATYSRNSATECRFGVSIRDSVYTYITQKCLLPFGITSSWETQLYIKSMKNCIRNGFFPCRIPIAQSIEWNFELEKILTKYYYFRYYYFTIHNVYMCNKSVFFCGFAAFDIPNRYTETEFLLYATGLIIGQQWFDIVSSNVGNCLMTVSKY